ncbi:hypothetical protein [Notoacmeibacter ruber]|uniref:DUF2190 domain-containing protein n=1 Tax=Notoacmeibacter ruber TaxID=2670375 RepID=A0A3L7JDP2_9HYPH|nr:hypothetical protein [Notoacmeibacter ruber]RLQ88908.1 hypothetical protein D8780_12405 [Notoacmeibacter ruber]
MSYALNRDIRSFPALTALTGYRIAAAAATLGALRDASAPSDSLVGVIERVGAEPGQMGDVTVAGETEVEAGGDLDFNDPITADADGRAVKAVAGAAGSTVHIIGWMRSPEAVAGDIVRIHVSPSIIVTPAA